MRTPEKSSLVLPAPDVSVPLRRMWKWSLAWRREGRLRELLSMLKTGLVLQTELKNNVDRYCITGTKNNVWPTLKKPKFLFHTWFFLYPGHATAFANALLQHLCMLTLRPTIAQQRNQNTNTPIFLKKTVEAVMLRKTHLASQLAQKTWHYI